MNKVIAVMVTLYSLPPVIEWSVDNAHDLIDALPALETGNDYLTFATDGSHPEDAAEERAAIDAFLQEPHTEEWLQRAEEFINRNLSGPTNGDLIAIMTPQPRMSKRDFIEMF